jgi:hypothetical protein
MSAEDIISVIAAFFGYGFLFIIGLLFVLAMWGVFDRDES